ncbi:MAG: hypothetical protein OXC80_08955 [Gammaproteobacteria bacterium]|nr:hypothetical protein [Gammaproteobacteria bacterium]
MAVAEALKTIHTSSNVYVVTTELNAFDASDLDDQCDQAFEHFNAMGGSNPRSLHEK